MTNVIMLNRMLSAFLGVLLVHGCAEPYQRQASMIPSNYIGKVAILYNQKYGQKEEYLLDRRIYRIPNCGILKTQFTLNDHMVWALQSFDSDVVFIRVDEHGNPTDTLVYWPRNGNSVSENAFFLENPDRVGILDWGFCGFSFGDSERYDDVEFFIVDSFKNVTKYSHPPFFDKADFKKCL